MVCVGVRLDCPHDLDAAPFGRLEHAVDRVRRVDDGRDAGLLVAHQIRRTTEIVVEKLLEEHGS
jgi:hypothetical protein